MLTGTANMVEQFEMSKLTDVGGGVYAHTL